MENDELRDLQEKADNGDPESQNALAYMYYFGEGLPQDYEKAFRLFHEAAENGYDDALENLGMCYFYGHGTEKDYELACRAFAKYQQTTVMDGFEIGVLCVKAWSYMGECYFRGGYGVEQSYEKAAEFFSKALVCEGSLKLCAGCHGRVVFRLAICYQYGLGGLKQDLTKAKKYYRALASWGDWHSKEDWYPEYMAIKL